MMKLLVPRISDFDKAVKIREESTEAFVDYWKEYSLFLSFEYWIMVAILVIPLVVLFLKIDKKNIFMIGFYGYGVHMLYAYIDLFGVNNGFWNYPFPVIPALPSFSMDSSLIPVTFMLIYQKTFNKYKKYYLYSIIAGFLLSFVFKFILVKMDLFRMYGNANYLHLLVAYLIVIVLAKVCSDVFLWLKKRYVKNEAY